VLRNDDIGRALIAQADAAMRAQGVVDPERMAATLAPACEPTTS
jgi:hypothetical protein